MRRRVMPFEADYVFLTLRVTPMSTVCITQMLYEVGNCAGYGPKFFSAHSFRAGYANRVAVQDIGTVDHSKILSIG